MSQEMSEFKEKVLPKFIKLKNEKFKKHGVSTNASGEYKIDRTGVIYEPIDAAPHRCNVSFTISGVFSHSDDFEIIIKDEIIS